MISRCPEELLFADDLKTLRESCDGSKEKKLQKKHQKQKADNKC